MTKLYNRNSEKAKRQQLRRNMTKAKFILWQKLKGKQLEGVKFRNQYGVGQFVVDFYCAELKLAIEIDGDSHFQAGAQEYDWERQVFIESVGIRFLRFTNNDVHGNLEGVLERILQKIGELRNDPPAPLIKEGAGDLIRLISASAEVRSLRWCWLLDGSRGWVSWCQLSL